MIVIALLSVLGVACQRQPEAVLPAPERACNGELGWRGLVPGKAARTDVIGVLGEPSETGTKQFSDGTRSYFGYAVETGVIGTYSQDLVYFRPSGLVDWIEVAVADRDGAFHTVQETSEILGTPPDTILVSIAADMAGPDQFVVWSDCGLALDVLMDFYVAEDGRVKRHSDENWEVPRQYVLATRYPNPFPGLDPSPDMRNIVLMRFVFQPTTYAGFRDYYQDRTPWGLMKWLAYLEAAPVP